MPSSTASCTQRTASPSTSRPCANHQKNPPSVASLTPTTPSEPLKPSMGATVRDHRNAVRDRSESLSAINRKPCPQSPESAVDRGLRAFLLVGAAQRLAIDGDHFCRQAGQRYHPSHEAALEFLGVQRGKDIAELIVRGRAIAK